MYSQDDKFLVKAVDDYEMSLGVEMASQDDKFLLEAMHAYEKSLDVEMSSLYEKPLFEVMDTEQENELVLLADEAVKNHNITELINDLENLCPTLLTQMKYTTCGTGEDSFFDVSEFLEFEKECIDRQKRLVSCKKKSVIVNCDCKSDFVM